MCYNLYVIVLSTTPSGVANRAGRTCVKHAMHAQQKQGRIFMKKEAKKK